MFGAPVIDLTGIEIGYADGSGLGGGGDAVALWLGDPTLFAPIALEAYPDTAPFDGQSYDSDLGEFSVVGNANGAVQTIALGGDAMDVPNIGSPGNQGPINGVSSITKGSITVYPNPSFGEITIEPNNAGILEVVEVYNAAGKAVWHQALSYAEPFTIDLSGFPSSVYYVQIRGTRGVFVERIVKQ